MAVQTPPQGRVGWHHALLVLSALCLGALLGHLASEHGAGRAEPSDVDSAELLREMRELREKVATLEEGPTHPFSRGRKNKQRVSCSHLQQSIPTWQR